jgi:hypothetical protein
MGPALIRTWFNSRPAAIPLHATGSETVALEEDAAATVGVPQPKRA